MAVNVIVDRNRSTRRFFLIVAVLFPLVVLAGFARTYYLNGILGGPAVPSLLIHLHGITMTAWIILLAVQVWLSFAAWATGTAA